MMKPILYHLFRMVYATKKWFSRRFTTSGRGILLCLAASAVVGLNTKATMAYQAFTLLISLLVVAMISSRFFRYRFSLLSRYLEREPQDFLARPGVPAGDREFVKEQDVGRTNEVECVVDQLEHVIEIRTNILAVIGRKYAAHP